MTVSCIGYCFMMVYGFLFAVTRFIGSGCRAKTVGCLECSTAFQTALSLLPAGQKHCDYTQNNLRPNNALHLTPPRRLLCIT